MNQIAGIDADTIVERARIAGQIRIRLGIAVGSAFAGISLIFAAIVVSWFLPSS